MKKLLTLALSLALVLSLSACGGNAPATAPSNSGAASDVSSKATPEAPKFPTKTIEIVVPYTAGGGLDTVTRYAAEALDLGVATAITNMVGGSSLVGVKDVANGDQSGHRYVAHHPESMPAYFLAGVFDENYGDQFQWICSYAYDPMCISVGKNSPINSWEDLVADAKSRPGEQTWGGSGNLSTNHMAAALAMELGGFVGNYVPYNGAADARIACIGGNLDVYIGQTSEMVAYAESGDLKIISTWGEERAEWLPDVSTMAEIMGTTEGTIYGLHRGVMAPAKVPAEIRQLLEDAYSKACTDPAWQASVADTLHYTPVFSTGKECEEIQKNATAITERALAFIEKNLG